MKGQKLSRRLVLAALALCPLAAAGCDTEAARFNNTLADYNRKLNGAGKQFVVVIAPALQGQAVNTDKLRQAHEALRETVREIKKEFAELEVPPTASGKRLAEGYARFLRSQDRMVLNEVGRIVRMLERAGNTRSANLEIMRIAQEMQRRENRDLAELHKLQREFAAEHQLPLLPPRN